MSSIQAAVSLTVLIVMSSTASPAARQDPPNLSGEWTLVAATTSGRPRGDTGPSSQPSDERPTGSNVASGAAFNCGRQCSIALRGQTLTISKALLGSETTPAPTVVLRLDGRQTSVVDSFNPQRQLMASAKWNGRQIEVVTAEGRHTSTQILSLEAQQLVVVNSVDISGSAAVTFRYRKR